MRFVAIVVVALLGLGPVARAAPDPKPTPAEKAETQALEKELQAEQIKQAHFASVKTLKKLVALDHKIYGDEARQTQNRKQQLASAYQMTGDYANALALDRELLALAEKLHGPDSREAFYALYPLVGPYWSQNRLDELEPIYTRLVALSKKLDGENSSGYATQLMQYGTLLNARNQYSSALRYYEQSLKIYEAAAKTPTDATLLGPVHTLASVYWQANQRAKAIPLFDRAIAIAEAQPKTDYSTMTIAGTIWGVAAVYHYGGRDDLANPLMKRVTDMYAAEVKRLEATKPDDPMLSAMMGQLGYSYRQMGDLPRAEETLTRVVALDDSKGRFSGWTAVLAEVERSLGKTKEALALLEKAQAALTKISASSATAYNTTIADVLRELGDYKRATALLDAYRASVAKTYGRHHPLYGTAELSAAYVYMASGNIAEAERTLVDSLDIAEKELQLVLKTGTESDHAVYFSRNGYQLDTAINFELRYAPKSPTAARLALTTLLRRKGRVLDAAAASLATIRSKLSPEDKQLLDDLAAARAKLAKLTVAGPTATGDEAGYAKEVSTLEDQIQKLELLVGSKSAAYRVVSQPIELPAIQKMIPKDARLVEIVNYQPADPKHRYEANPVLLPRRYAAYVLAAKGDPTVIDLGDAPAIDAGVEAFRKAVADPDNDRAAELGHDLYTLTLAKVVPALGGATNVLLAPDGALNVVPFSALVDDKQEFLIKKYTFTYLTSGRDLMRLGVKTKAQGGGVIFADPSFDATGAAPAAGKEADGAAGNRGRRSADLASLSWQPLPGTGQEADAVQKTLRDVKVFRGAQATEASVKAVHGPRILHLATHGFFLPDEPPPQQAADSSRAGGAPGPALPAGAPGGGPTPGGDSYENPLLRSGLVFAGANKLSSGDEDGILTAMEASGLDLWGTKLVVLSACETGIGKITNGDGVYGLRRALVIAGAESLVTTLWQVDDLATKDLMSGYYKRLGKGEARSSALRETQLEVGARDKYKHPYYWASFLPAGDNSPLKE